MSETPLHQPEGTPAARAFHESAPASQPATSGYWQRRQDRAVAAAEARVFDRLVRSPGDLSGPPRSRAYVLASTLVLALAVVAVVALVWATLSPKGFWGWVGVVLGWVVVYELAPRPDHLDGVVLEPESAPAVHRMVAALSEAVGVRPPRVVTVDTSFNAYVTQAGWAHRSALVIGLPLWTVLKDDQRVALLGHELGHLRGRDTVTGVITSAAHGIAERVTLLLTPLSRGAYSDFEEYDDVMEHSQGFMNRIGRMILHVVALPLLGVVRVLDRLALADSHHREFAADLRAAQVAGTAASVGALAIGMNLPGIHAVANAAVRRQEDAFAALDAVRRRPAPSAADVERLHLLAAGEQRRWDSSHPTDARRLQLLKVAPVPPAWPPLLDVTTADVELRRLRPNLARQLRDDLIDDWC